MTATERPTAAWRSSAHWHARCRRPALCRLPRVLRPAAGRLRRALRRQGLGADALPGARPALSLGGLCLGARALGERLLRAVLADDPRGSGRRRRLAAPPRRCGLPRGLPLGRGARPRHLPQPLLPGVPAAGHSRARAPAGAGPHAPVVPRPAPGPDRRGLHLCGHRQAQPRLAPARRAPPHLALRHDPPAPGRAPARRARAGPGHELGRLPLRPEHRALAQPPENPHLCLALGRRLPSRDRTALPHRHLSLADDGRLAAVLGAARAALAPCGAAPSRLGTGPSPLGGSWSRCSCPCATGPSPATSPGTRPARASPGG